ncbi:MAG: hypothetical protein IJM59_05155 [Proteobacteria bacterium]|nr:hypothetical protein [Pseudomonadota bacterium]
MPNKQIILFCMVAATLCSCKTKPNPTASEPPANQEQVVQNADDKPAPCGDTNCKDGEICKDNRCEAAVPADNPPAAPDVQPAPSESQPPIAQIADEDHPQCGETVCQFGEICRDNQCKTKFEMNIYLAPTPKEGTVKNDSYDYWECQSETCTYEADKTYTIPKGIRVREMTAYCGGEGIGLYKLKDHTCTNKGWVCVSPDGCDGCAGEDRWNSSNEVKCSPGEMCRNGHGCDYANADIPEVSLCENGDCKCGKNQCGKNQICAYGNCYFAGEIRNGFGDCEFEDEYDICGTSDTPEHLIRYLCPRRCPSEILPENQDGYELRTPTIGDCHGFDIRLWTCQNEEGCKCGDKTCPNDTSCINGKCALRIADEYFDSDEITDVDRFFASTCATDYPIFSYQPKDAEHYHIAKEESYPYIQYWSCSAPNECLCNGEKLPPNTICHGNMDGTEYITALPNNFDGTFHRAPKNTKNYIYKNDQWVCENESCLCGDKPLPKNAHCKEDKIYCYDNEKISDVTGYECNENERNWICASDNCLCGGKDLRPGANCMHWEGNDYQCCGSTTHGCFTAQTASEHDCIDKAWVVKAEEGQRHCRNKTLPAGASCASYHYWQGGKVVFGEYAKCGDEERQNWDDYRCENGQWKCALEDKPCLCKGKHLPEGTRCGWAYNLEEEYAICGGESLLVWDDYRCENGQWKCALKDRPCLCHGNPLPDGAHCFNGEAYCGSVNRDNWAEESCINGEWVYNAVIAQKSESHLCFGHKLNEGVICPAYNVHDYHFVDDIEMSDMESCEHVRGCLCHQKLCPPSGICTDHGCIDPLTDKPFEAKDGYLVSDKLRQCAQPNGCKCGESEIEYRDYCYNDEQYISMKSCVSDKKRIIGENNYISYDCEYGDAPWYNGCKPDPEIDSSQYFIRDCLTATALYFSDRDVDHQAVPVCIQKEGCQCIHNTCKYGEACYKGQCIDEYPCHDLADYGENEDEVGKCRPLSPEG